MAISNSRLLNTKDNEVAFRYKNYRKKGKQETMTIGCVEFARRFLIHILLLGFYKIRYYGVLASVNCNTKRQQAASLIGKITWLPVLEGLTAYEVYRMLSGNDPISCPKCKNGIMRRYKIEPNPG